MALHPGKQEHLTMVSTVSNQGTMRWMIVDGKFDTSRMIEFLERLIQDADIKQYVGSRVQVRSKDKLKTTTSYHLRLLQQQPERIKSYFQDPRVKYAT